MKSVLLALMLVALSQPTHAEDCPLIGKWKSDKGKTLPHLYGVKNMRPSTRAQISKILGKMVVEYPSCSEYIVELDGEISRGALEVVSYKGNVLNARAEGEEETSRFVFEGDCYYTMSKPFMMKEYFCRI